MLIALFCLIDNTSIWNIAIKITKDIGNISLNKKVKSIYIIRVTIYVELLSYKCCGGRLYQDIFMGLTP